jgi:transposase
VMRYTAHSGGQAMKPRRLTPTQERRLLHQLNTTPSKRVYRRTLGVLEYGRGGSATAIARQLGVHRCHVYRWWTAYGLTHDPAALEEAERCGRPALWSQDCTRWLEQLMRDSPQDWGYPAVDWTVPVLVRQLEALTGWCFSQGTLRQALHDLDYVWIRSRYELEPDPELEKKSPNSPENQSFAAPQRSAGRR